MEISKKLKEEDREDLEKLFAQLSKKHEKIDIRNIIDDSNCHVALLRDEQERLIGFAALLVYLVPSKGYVGRIEDVIVSDEYRGEGLGRKIMRTLVEDAKKLNLIHLDLTSNPERIPARRLYESLGFQLRNTGVFRKEL